MRHAHRLHLLNARGGFLESRVLTMPITLTHSSSTTTLHRRYNPWSETRPGIYMSPQLASFCIERFCTLVVGSSSTSLPSFLAGSAPRRQHNPLFRTVPYVERSRNNDLDIPWFDYSEARHLHRRRDFTLGFKRSTQVIVQVGPISGDIEEQWP